MARKSGSSRRTPPPERKAEPAETLEVHIIESEVATAAETSLPTVFNGPTPMMILQGAIDNGASVETLERLLALQERWEKSTAKRAFTRAIALAKAKIPVIVKNRHVYFKPKSGDGDPVDYWHEDMAQIASVIDPILSQFGLAYRFSTSSAPNQPITVTCILSHADGHSEENSLSGPRDNSGRKNELQAVGSAVTFLQRYTLKAALGLAAGMDDDGGDPKEPTRQTPPGPAPAQKPQERDYRAPSSDPKTATTVSSAATTPPKAATRPPIEQPMKSEIQSRDYWLEFHTYALGCIQDFQSIDQANQFIIDDKKTLDMCSRQAPELREEIGKAFAQRMAELAGAGKAL